MIYNMSSSYGVKCITNYNYEGYGKNDNKESGDLPCIVYLQNSD